MLSDTRWSRKPHLQRGAPFALQPKIYLWQLFSSISKTFSLSPIFVPGWCAEAELMIPNSTLDLGKNFVFIFVWYFLFRKCLFCHGLCFPLPPFGEWAPPNLTKTPATSLPLLRDQKPTRAAQKHGPRQESWSSLWTGGAAESPGWC